MIVEITQMKHVDARIIASKPHFHYFYISTYYILRRWKILENIILIDYWLCRLNNEFLCKDNSCVRNRPNSKYDPSTWMDATNEGLNSNSIACNGVAECSDGSDESLIYAGCRKQNGACMFFLCKYMNI